MSKKAPAVKVRGRGQVSTILETYAQMYREKYPDRDARYVYDPLHKPELSGVLGRQAAGYEDVTWEMLGTKPRNAKEDDVVRVSDLVLMSISKIEKLALIEEKEELAQAQRDTVKREFYESQENAGQGAKLGHHTRNPTSPIGTVEIKDKEFSYDIEQRKE